MKRRRLLQTTLAGSATAMLSGGLTTAVGDDSSFAGIIDSNVSLFRWPFRRLPLDETEKLVAKLRTLGTVEAWAGSFECVFHRDLASANARLIEECARFPELIPVGTVNPALPGWERDLDRCIGEFGMNAIRLHPTVHGYSLKDARFREMLVGAKEAGLLVQLAVTLEDSRTQHESFATPDADLSPLVASLAKVRGARVQLLNLRPRRSHMVELAAVPNLLFDAARADGTDGVASLLSTVGSERVLFGTHAPFLIPEAALIRVHESALDPAPLRSVLRENAEKLRS